LVGLVASWCTGWFTVDSAWKETSQSQQIENPEERERQAEPLVSQVLVECRKATRGYKGQEKREGMARVKATTAQMVQMIEFEVIVESSYDPMGEVQG